MQVIHECWDNRNDHIQTRMQERSKGNTRSTLFEGAPSSDIEETNMTKVLEHLDDINRGMLSRRLEEASWDTQERLDRLTNVGFFSTSHGGRATNDGTLEDEW
jgi:hypothetical protein